MSRAKEMWKKASRSRGRRVSREEDSKGKDDGDDSLGLCAKIEVIGATRNYLLKVG